jgi:hypothetical protein
MIQMVNLKKRYGNKQALDGIFVIRLELSKMTLEDIFLSLTGKSLTGKSLRD